MFVAGAEVTDMCVTFVMFVVLVMSGLYSLRSPSDGEKVEPGLGCEREERKG